MKKKITCITLFVVLLVSLCVPAHAVEAYDNFTNKNVYANQFTDVNPANWFADYVKQAYEYGLVQGVSDTKFAPDDDVTIAQTITLAARLHSIYTTGAEPDGTVGTGGSWYDPYVDYALANGIIEADYSSYNAPAPRSTVAVIFSRSLPAGSLNQIRTVGDGVIPDVSMSATYSTAVYTLYRAGVLSGNDDYGTFSPNANIKRSEIAAICIRIADSSQRSTVAIGNAERLTAQQISEKCAAAVFFIQTYSFNGKAGGTGSGFFISSDGLAVTNYHVVANSSKIEIRTSDKKTYNDIKIIALDETNDLALLKINGTGFSYLEAGDSSGVKQGQQVFAIGSPLGLENTMSQGIISNASRALDGVTFIQIAVPIAPGSSGGALINEQGRVIGVTTAGFTNANADLNLAIPINAISTLDRTAASSLICWNNTCYPGFTRALDFGAFSGVKLLSVEQEGFGYTFIYDIWDFHDIFDLDDSDCYAYTMYFYYLALLEQGFTHAETTDTFEGTFESGTERVVVTSDLQKTKTIRINTVYVPQYYREFSKLPDFGWFSDMAITGTPSVLDGSTVYEYKFIDYFTYNEFKSVLFSYFDMLSEIFGYEYISEDGTTYLFEGSGLSVAFVHDNRSLYIDVLPI